MPPEGEPSTGAIPGAGAMPAQPDPQSPPQPPPQSATRSEELGEAGRRALDAERQGRSAAEERARQLEQELEQLRGQNQTEAEQALSKARREAANEERSKWQRVVREAHVAGALRGAGILNDRFLQLALGAPQLANLKVADDGTVEGMAEAIEQLKKDIPEAFGTSSRRDDWDAAAGGGKPKPAATLEEAVVAEVQKQRR